MAAVEKKVEEIPEEFQSMLDTEFFPTIADVIDRAGGLCRLDLVCTDLGVATLRDSFPREENKRDSPFRMTKLLSQVPQFFTLLDGNDKVCTALGYDNEYVDAEHNVTQKGTELLQEQKDSKIIEMQRAEYLKSKGKPDNQGVNPRQKEARPVRERPVNVKVKQANPVGPKRQIKEELITAAKDLQNLAVHGTKREFENCFRHCQDLRMQRDGGGLATPRQAVVPAQNKRAPMVRGGVQPRANAQARDNRRQSLVQPLRQQPVNEGRLPRVRGRTTAGGPSNAAPERPQRERGERGGKGRKRGRGEFDEPKVPTGSPEQMLQVERLMRMCVPHLKKAADQKVMLSNLADIPEIRNQKRYLNGVSFGRLFDTAYPSFFDVNCDPANNQMHVTLISDVPKGTPGSLPPNELPMPFKKKRAEELEAEKEAAAIAAI